MHRVDDICKLPVSSFAKIQLCVARDAAEVSVARGKCIAFRSSALRCARRCVPANSSLCRAITLL